MYHTCFKTKLAGFNIELVQLGTNNFTVMYGAQVWYRRSYVEAGKDLGYAIMHAAACEGKLENDPKL